MRKKPALLAVLGLIGALGLLALALRPRAPTPVQDLSRPKLSSLSSPSGARPTSEAALAADSLAPPGAEPLPSPAAGKTAEKLAVKPCERLLDHHFGFEGRQKKDFGFDCVDYKHWGSYGFDATDPRYSSLEISLEVDPEEHRKATKGRGDFALKILIQIKSTETGEVEESLERSLRMPWSEISVPAAFVLNPSYGPIRAQILDLLRAHREGSPPFTREFEANWEACYHLNDPKQWLKTESKWTEVNHDGVVKVGDRYVELRHRGGIHQTNDCVYAR